MTKISNPLPKLLSASDAADHLGVCTKTIRRIIAAELPITRVGRAIRITEADLGPYLARGRGVWSQMSNIGRLCPQHPSV